MRLGPGLSVAYRATSDHVEEVRSITVPMKEHRFNQGDHVSTSVVACTHDGHVDGLWRQRSSIKGSKQTLDLIHQIKQI